MATPVGPPGSEKSFTEVRVSASGAGSDGVLPAKGDDKVDGEPVKLSAEDLELWRQFEAMLMEEAGVQPQRKPDIMRETLIRYLGYSNEVGESFRAIMPRLVAPSYVLAYGYAVADGVMKSLAEKEDGAFGRPIAAFFDTLLWQTFASVLLPGLTINRIVYFSSQFLAKQPLPAPAKKWIPVALGLTSIPAIIHPIDDFVESVMNRTVRQVTKFEPRTPHQFSEPISLFKPRGGELKKE